MNEQTNEWKIICNAHNNFHYIKTPQWQGEHNENCELLSKPKVISSIVSVLSVAIVCETVCANKLWRVWPATLSYTVKVRWQKISQNWVSISAVGAGSLIIRVCVSVCVFLCACLCTGVCACVCFSMHVCVLRCVCVCISLCMFVYRCVSVCVCMCVCVQACECVSVCIFNAKEYIY